MIMKHIIKLKYNQVILLRILLKRFIKDGFPKNSEWHDEYKLIHHLNLKFDLYHKNGILDISRETQVAIMNFTSSYMNDNKDRWKPCLWYSFFKLYLEIWFQSIIESDADQENWMWCIHLYYPDKNKHTHFRKW